MSGMACEGCCSPKGGRVRRIVLPLRSVGSHRSGQVGCDGAGARMPGRAWRGCGEANGSRLRRWRPRAEAGEARQVGAAGEGMPGLVAPWTEDVRGVWNIWNLQAENHGGVRGREPSGAWAGDSEEIERRGADERREMSGCGAVRGLLERRLRLRRRGARPTSQPRRHRRTEGHGWAAAASMDALGAPGAPVR